MSRIIPRVGNRFSRTVAWIALFASFGPVPPLPGQVIETEEGPVEFIGLRHWTPEQVRDTLRSVRPDLSLHSAACAAVLQHEIGFPAASVGSIRAPWVPEGYTAITLVEPEEAHRVRYAEPPPDSLGPVEGWDEAYELFPGRRWAWAMAIQKVDEGGRSLPDSTSLPRVRSFIDSHAGEADRLRALEVLETDRNWINRAIATAVLSNFPEHDETWWVLAGAARGIGPDDYGVYEPITVLQYFLRDSRPIDWSPVTDDLRALLDGTNVHAFTVVLRLLHETSVSPDLAGPLLAGGGELVLAHLRATNPYFRGEARRFLETISGGQDFGEDPDRWREWVGSLGADADDLSPAWMPGSRASDRLHGASRR